MYDATTCLSDHIVIDIVELTSFKDALKLLTQGYMVTWGSQVTCVAVNNMGSYRVATRHDTTQGARYMPQRMSGLHLRQPSLDEHILLSFMRTEYNDGETYRAIKLQALPQDPYYAYEP